MNRTDHIRKFVITMWVIGTVVFYTHPVPWWIELISMIVGIWCACDYADEALERNQ